MPTKYPFILFVAIILIITLVVAGSNSLASAQGVDTSSSPFYKFDIVAKTGDIVKNEIIRYETLKTPESPKLIHIEPGAAINDAGEVVFLANHGKRIVRRKPSGELEGITPVLNYEASHEIKEAVTLNNLSAVIALDRQQLNSNDNNVNNDDKDTTYHLHRIDPIRDRKVDPITRKNRDLNKLMAGAGLNFEYPDMGPKFKISKYEKIFPCTSINNRGLNHEGQIVFLAFRSPYDFFLVTTEEYIPPEIYPRKYLSKFYEAKIEIAAPDTQCPSITDDGRVLIRTKSETTAIQAIQLFNFELTRSETIATTQGTNRLWSSLGMNPGISRSGKVIVFYGDLTAAGAPALQTVPGPGIFASVDEGIPDTRKIVRIAGWPVGYAEYIEAPGGNDDGFCDPGEECLEDVKAAQDAGTWDKTPQCDRDETCVQFSELGFDETGKPLGGLSSFDKASPVAVIHEELGKPDLEDDNFTVAFLTELKALWTVRVDITSMKDIGQSEQSRLIYQPMRPQRVVQVNDKIEGFTILDIAIHEPLAKAGIGNHQLAFWAETNKGEMVVRATLDKRIVVNTGSATVDGDTNSVRALLANPGADGKISLSEALSAVNQSGPGYTINFNLPFGVTAINVTNGLQLISSNTIIDGDNDRNGKPDFDIQESQYFGSRLIVSSNSNLIRGISIKVIVFDGVDAHDNTLLNCFAGTRTDGGVVTKTEDSGIVIRNGAHHNRIVGNLVAENYEGITIQDGAHDNLIGEPEQPNLYPTCNSTCNVIKANRNGGVVVRGNDTYGNSIRGNLIFDNRDLILTNPPKAIGIDLGGDGITLNQIPARMQGPNELLNAPMSLAADFDGTNTVISGVYKAPPIDPTSVIIDIYGKKMPGDFGEANLYLGFTTPKPNGTFELVIQRKLPVPYVSATATDNKGNTSEFSLQTPIIFVPGVAASILNEDGEEIWLGLNTLLKPRILGPVPLLVKAAISMNSFRQRLNLMNPTKGKSVATDVLRYVPPDFLGPVYPKWIPGLIIYGDFLNDLIKKGYYREYDVSDDPQRRTFLHCDYERQSSQVPNLFVFAYDWRLSNIANAEKLKDYMGCVQKFYPGARVNLVAHSMGGILSRRYILDNREYHHVGRMISIATPWIGAGKVAYALATGDFIPVIASSESIKDAMWSMPSAHELFLSPTWLDPTKLKQEAPIYGVVEKGGVYYSVDSNDYESFMSLLPTIARCKPSALNPCEFPLSLAREFHNEDQEFMRPDTTGVKYFHLYSEQFKDQTVRRVEAKFTPARCKLSTFGINICYPPGIYFERQWGRGDETVPLLSLSPWATASYSGTAYYETTDHRIVCGFRSPSESDDKYYAHPYIPNNELMRNKVLELLIGSSPLPEVCMPHADSQVAQRQNNYLNIDFQNPKLSKAQIGAQEQLKASTLEINGISGMLISNRAGNITAIISNTMLIDDIPDISLGNTGEQFTQWTLAPTETYTVALLTTDEPFSIVLTTNDGFNIRQAVRYQDLVLTQGITATLVITPSKIPTLSYDGNRDGLLETVITPTIVVTGSLATDIEPPDITIRVTEVQTPFLTVNLSAQDSGAGVKALWYSLDGTHYQSYKAPFPAHTGQTLYTFADDNVANRGTKIQTLDITPPNVHIHAPIPLTSVNRDTPITVSVIATDNVFVSSVNVIINTLGEGKDTTLPATRISTDTFQALFAPITGSLGVRTIHVEALDPSGNKGVAETTIDVRSEVPTPTPPITVTVTDTPTPIPFLAHLRIESPAEGTLLSIRDPFKVHLATNTTADIRLIIVTFDVDGNGTLDGPGEAQTADQDSGGSYTVQFKSITGSPGVRYVHAFAIDASGAVVTASRKVIVTEASKEPTITPTPTPVACPTDSVTVSGGCATITPTPTATATPTPTATSTPTSTDTPSPTPSATLTSSATPTPTSTATATATDTKMATVKPTQTKTPTLTLTPTLTISEVRWKANGSGSWDEPGNWDTGAVPSPNSVVIIDKPDVTVTFSQGTRFISSLNCAGNFIISGGTLDIAKTSVISKTFVLKGGALTGSGDLTVNGELTWSAGYMSGSGRTIASSKLRISESAEKRLSGRTLENLHEATWSAPAHTGFLILEAGAIFKNRPGAVFDMQFDGYLAGNATFANEGTLIKSAGADTAEVTVAFNNSGKVEIQTGLLSLKGGGVSQGEFIAAPEAMLSFGAHTFERGAQIKAAYVRFESNDIVEFKAGSIYNVTDSTDFVSGAINFSPGSMVEKVGSSVAITAASVNFSGSSVITTQNLVLANGELKGANDVIIADYLAWHGGQMSGAGRTILEGEADLNGGNMTLNGRTFDNRGTINWSSLSNGPVRLFMGGGAILNNDGYFYVRHNSPGIGILQVYDGMETVNNNGKFFLHDSSGVVEIRAAFNNRGEVNVESGTLRLAGGGVASGQFLGAEGATLAFGRDYTLAQPSKVNAANINFDGGTTDIYGVYNVTDTTGVISGYSPTVNFKPGARIISLGHQLSIGGNCTLDLSSNTPVALNELSLLGGMLTGTDDITINGKFTWEDSVISGSGEITANGGIEIKGNGRKGLSGRTLDNKGVATWDGLAGANSLHISSGGIFNNLPNAVFNVKFDGNITYEGGGTFNNLGILRKSGGTRVMQITAIFNNSGEVRLEKGTLRLTGRGVASGQFFGADGATLAFGSYYTLAKSSIVNIANINFDGGGTVDIYGAYNVTDSTSLSGIASPTVNFKPGARVISLGHQLSIGGNCTLDLSSNTPIAFNDLVLALGKLTGIDDITINGKFTWDSGTISGAGKLIVNGELEIHQPQSGGLQLAGRTLENRSKKANWLGGIIYAYSGAIFHNSSEGILNVTGNTGFVWCEPTWDSCSMSGEQPTFTNDGLIVKSASGTMSLNSSEGSSTIFNNGGIVDVRGGEINFAGGYNQSAGMLHLNGGHISATDAEINIQGGIVSGTGTIAGTLVNAGQLSTGDSVGTLVIAGDYRQTATGSLLIKIGGLNPGSEYDQINVLGAATLGGKVKIILTNGFAPERGNRFQIFSYEIGSGQFTSFSGLELGNGKRLRTIYSTGTANVPSGLILETVSSP